MPTTDEVLRSLSKWKYIITSDLKSAFFQIKVSDSSIKWLGTVTPYKGLRVYTRAAMGLRDSSEYLEEMLSRVPGDLLPQGVLVKIHDDLVIGGRTVDELQSNWIKVLQRLQQNNIFLSAEKTVICPMTVTILGWIWSQGTLKK